MPASLVAVAVGGGEAGGDEVVVGEVEPHPGAGTDAEDFVEVVGRAAREEAEGKVVECPRPAEEVDRFVEVLNRFGATGRVSAAEQKVIKADVEE